MVTLFTWWTLKVNYGCFPLNDTSEMHKPAVKLPWFMLLPVIYILVYVSQDHIKLCSIGFISILSRKGLIDKSGHYEQLQSNSSNKKNIIQFPPYLSAIRIHIGLRRVNKTN